MPLFRKRVVPRDQISLDAQTLLTQNFTREGVGTSSAMVSGTVYAMLLGFEAGDVISNIHLSVVVNGTTSTLAKAGVYSLAGARLAVSANLTTQWDSTGMKVAAMGTPYTVTARGGLYICLLNVAATGASPLRGNSSTTGNEAVGSGSALYATEAAQTDLDATVTLGDTSPLAFWIGIS